MPAARNNSTEQRAAKRSSELQKVPCPNNCGSMLKRASDVSRHLKGSCKNVPDSQKVTWTCTVDNCGATFTQKDNMTTHIRSVHDRKTYKCTWEGCDLIFPGSSQRSRHINKIHKTQADMKPKVAGKAPATQPRLPTRIAEVVQDVDSLNAVSNHFNRFSSTPTSTGPSSSTSPLGASSPSTSTSTRSSSPCSACSFHSSSHCQHSDSPSGPATPPMDSTLFVPEQYVPNVYMVLPSNECFFQSDLKPFVPTRMIKQEAFVTPCAKYVPIGSEVAQLVPSVNVSGFGYIPISALAAVQAPSIEQRLVPASYYDGPLETYKHPYPSSFPDFHQQFEASYQPSHPISPFILPEFTMADFETVPQLELPDNHFNVEEFLSVSSFDYSMDWSSGFN